MTKPIDFDDISTYPLKSRESKVKVGDFAKVTAKGSTFRQFLDHLPNILIGADFMEAVELCAQAKRRGKPIIFGMGSHVIKCGLNPLLIDLLQGGIITGIALNGSGIIHDFELAYIGQTSEDVAASLGTGQFGMAEETGRHLNTAIKDGNRDGKGLGHSIGRQIETLNLKHKAQSLLWNCFMLERPVTVHVAIGTDIIHFSPQADGAAIGATTHQDFKLFCGEVKGLNDGGVYINAGSAVILPEVFLKAVSVVRNLNFPLKNFHTITFDFIRHYRPLTNVTNRPTQDGGRGFYFVGHHEIMIPLWAAALKEYL